MLKVGVICVLMLRIVWAIYNILISLCAWHVLKAWCLCAMENIKDVEVQQIILHDLHDVMYISIEPKENIETFKEQRKMKVLQNYEHNPSDSWTNYFWTYYYQFGMCSFSISIFQNMFI